MCWVVLIPLKIVYVLKEKLSRHRPDIYKCSTMITETDRLRQPCQLCQLKRQWKIEINYATFFQMPYTSMGNTFEALFIRKT